LVNKQIFEILLDFAAGCMIAASLHLLTWSQGWNFAIHSQWQFCKIFSKIAAVEFRIGDIDSSQQQKVYCLRQLPQ
jgi:hypothetical protein